MNGKNIELTRRRVLGGIVTVGAASAAAGAGTFAWFSDTETSSENSVSAGTLDLLLNDGNSATETLDVSGLAPGDAGYIVFEVTNDGSVTGTLGIELSSLSESDDTATEFESNPSEDSGELASKLNVTGYIVSSGVSAGVEDSAYSESGDEIEVLSEQSLADAVDAGAQDSSETLSDGTKYVVLAYQVLTSAENEIQGDSATFDITITLDQQRS